MKIEFIKRGAATRLILIFAGWSTDTRYYNDCVFDGWDTAVVSDYRDMTLPDFPSQYSTIYIFAYSLGVWAASVSAIHAAARIAICGSPIPISDRFGIPEAIYNATFSGLDERSLHKFHIRMAGDRRKFDAIKNRFPEKYCVSALKDELLNIASVVNGQDNLSGCFFDRAYIALDDKIFPYGNLKSYWDRCPDTVEVSFTSPHAVDIAQIIKDCIPDTMGIGKSFEKAKSTYGENAIIQSEICERIGENLKSFLNGRDRKVNSLLEIGVGGGQLTEIWRRILTPDCATYIDLFELPIFGIAKSERYIVADAEEWLKSTDESFDMIFSASTIQWFADPVNFIRAVKGHLNPGGIALISTFVRGNMHELDAIRPCPVIYRTAEEYKCIPGVQVSEWERTLVFHSSRALMMHLKLTGVSPRRKTSSVHLSSFPTELTYRPIIIIIKA
ncbi:MAG: DUF452 family protein [Muribaculaceae bacterium]|nr:DUF452 family protein [Muribaculaceae bacterium]